MTGDRSKRLEAIIDDLLKRERQRPGIPSDVDQRLEARLGPLLGPIGGPGGGDGGGDGSGGSGGDTGISSGSASGADGSPPVSGPGGADLGAATSAAASTTTGSAIAAIGLGKVATALLVTFSVGMGAGAGVHSLLTETSHTHPPGEITSTVGVAVDGAPQSSDETPRPLDSEELNADGSLPPTLPSEDAATTADSSPTDARVREAPSPRPPSDDDLNRERALIERAYSAIARGNNGEALSALREHAVAFPRGSMAEEREAIMIRALVGVGHHGEALRRAGRFERRYPRSLFIPIVRSAIRSIPDPSDSQPSHTKAQTH